LNSNVTSFACTVFIIGLYIDTTTHTEHNAADRRRNRSRGETRLNKAMRGSIMGITLSCRLHSIWMSSHSRYRLHPHVLSHCYYIFFFSPLSASILSFCWWHEIIRQHRWNLSSLLYLFNEIHGDRKLRRIQCSILINIRQVPDDTKLRWIHLTLQE